MAKVEVEQADYDLAVQQDQLLADMLGNPETASIAKRLIKKVRPNANIPELDAMDAVETSTKKIKDETDTELKGMRDDLKKFMDAQTDKERTRELQATVDAVATKYSFTDEGKQKLIARAKEKNHLDFEAHATAILAAEPKNSPVRSTSFFPESANLYGSRDAYMGNKLNDDVARLHKDPLGYAESMATDMMNNPENYPELVN